MKKLAIVGSDKRTNTNAPYGDKSFDIWVFNEAPLNPWCKRYSALFQMHREKYYTSDVDSKHSDYWPWLQEKHDVPVYMLGEDARVPDCRVYPLAAALLINNGEEYFTSTVAYAIALAIVDEYEQIDVYGIHLDANSEYRAQAECYRYWVGFARGRGIKVNVYSGEYLFNAPLYGYSGRPTIPEEYFSARVARHSALFDAAERNLENVKKVLEKTLKRGQYNKLQSIISNLQTSAMECGERAGEQAEAEKNQAENHLIDRHKFEMRAAAAQRDGEANRTMMLTTIGKIEYVWNVWNQTKNPQAIQQMVTFIGQMVQFAYDTGAHLGIYHENLEYIVLVDELVINSGGRI